tara:strand:- start:118 stop:288 length:171 start_codon:yes stop_codon:yes gene_type:complete
VTFSPVTGFFLGTYSALFSLSINEIKIFKEKIMNQIIYLVGLVVVVMAILSFIGLA